MYVDGDTEIMWIDEKVLVSPFLHICLLCSSSQATRQTGGGLDTQESAEILQGLYLLSGILKNKLNNDKTKSFSLANIQ